MKELFKEFLDGFKNVLLQYRILEVTTISYLCYELHMLFAWMTTIPYHQLTEWQLAAPAAALPALITGLFATVQLAIKERSVDHPSSE